ncbi:MAG: LiaI-LiaF-like domain-containing protein [Haloarculaceae archaeon]
MADRRPPTQVVVGLVIVLLGAVLLLDTTGLYDTGSLLRFAPLLFVLAGVYALVASGFRNVTGPVVLILLAGGAQLVALDYLEWSDLAALWPVFLIVFGVSLLTGHYRRSVPTTDASTVNSLALFSGVERRATGEDFEGGSLVALFGGVELDLRDATPRERPARIDATALFGGVDIVVPRDWNVEFDVLPVLGGADDERLRTERDHEETDLVVTGFAAFGGVSISD